MKFFSLSLILFLVLSITLGIAQTQTISGKIVAFKKYPLKNIKVSSKKGKTEVFSDAEGNFSIVCNKKDQLSFKAGGFYSQKIKVNSDDYLFVNLLVIQVEGAYKDIVKGEHMTKVDLDYCIENLIVENNNFEQFVNIYDIIQYVYPQAKVYDPSKHDGSGTVQIILDSRGVNSALADLQALLVVDGIVVNDISGVHPTEVKSVQVLMGNNAGHWGIRGGNGVVEITTKYQ